MAKLSPFAQSIFTRTYQYEPGETWEQCAWRVADAIANDDKQRDQFFRIINERLFLPGGRYLYCAGRPLPQYNNCTGFIAGDSREAWAKLLHDVTICLSMGAGLGINYSNVRPRGTPIKRMGGEASGPLALMEMINEVARHVMAGGKRRSALFGGLAWYHSDLPEFLMIKQWSDTYKKLKAESFEHPAPLDMTNISVLVDDAYLRGLRVGDPDVWRIHRQTCTLMCQSGEPGFINMSRRLQDDPEAHTMNACCEATLHHNDVCNLGSIVLPRIRHQSELEEVTRLAIQFLYQGSMKATYPTPEIAAIAKKNRRIGLGIMGLHEWLLRDGAIYEWTPRLERWMNTWASVSNHEADTLGRTYGTRPVATRAIAPTGTISIIAETTGGIEPIYCVSYKRRYIDRDKHYFQYVVDPTAKRLIDMGIPAIDIEDAYQLSRDIHRRLNMQAHLQEYVDQAISSTINIPEWGTARNNNPHDFADLVAEYLPRIKGLTVYPHNARPGQPLSPIDINEAIKQTGVVFEEDESRCNGMVCGV